MKLFSRTSSPLSVDSVPRKLSTPTTIRQHHHQKQQLRHSSDLSHPSPPRRPRLRHGPPPFFAGWAFVRAASSRIARRDLRFCTLAGPTLRYSATPSQDILANSVLVYGASVTAEEFPTLKIVVRPKEGPRIAIYPESKTDHAEWLRELQHASCRCLTHAYAFSADLRPTAFGRTSTALELDTSTLVSVKTISKYALSAPHVAAARKEPIVLLSIPEHPNVVAIADMYESARSIYLVTEHIPSISLEQLVLQRGAVCEADVATIIHDLLSALVHLHHYGVAHRLLCPENVLVEQSADPSGRASKGASVITRAQLCNFELSVSSVDTDEPTSLLDSFSENGPLYLQHAMYLAPEVCAGKIGDYAQDVWSLGILMHYLLVGCTPFDNGMSNLSNLCRVIAATKGMPSFSGPLWRGISSGAKHLCASMLHADPNARIKATYALEHPWLNM